MLGMILIVLGKMGESSKMTHLEDEIEGFEVIFLDFGSSQKWPPGRIWRREASKERRGEHITTHDLALTAAGTLTEEKLPHTDPAHNVTEKLSPVSEFEILFRKKGFLLLSCLLYTSDAADE